MECYTFTLKVGTHWTLSCTRSIWITWVRQTGIWNWSHMGYRRNTGNILLLLQTFLSTLNLQCMILCLACIVKFKCILVSMILTRATLPTTSTSPLSLATRSSSLKLSTSNKHSSSSCRSSAREVNCTSLRGGLKPPAKTSIARAEPSTKSTTVRRMEETYIENTVIHFIPYCADNIPITFCVHLFVTMSQNLPKCSKLAFRYVCAVRTPTPGLYVQIIRLIELS